MMDQGQLFDPARMLQYQISRQDTPYPPDLMRGTSPAGGGFPAPAPTGVPGVPRTPMPGTPVAAPQGFTPPQGGFGVAPGATVGVPTIGIPDVEDDELAEWLKALALDPNQAEDLNKAMWAARYAKIGVDVMKKHKLFSGDKAQEHLLWEDLVLSLVEATDDDGNPVPNPIESDEEAVADFVEGCMNLRGAKIKKEREREES